MKIQALVNYPTPETEPTFDWTAFSHQNNEHQLNYFIYASKRDFLSTPRSFTVLELSNDDTSRVNCTWFEQQDYFEMLQISLQLLDSGLYQTKDDSGNNLFLLAIDQNLIEIAADQIHLVKTIYHCADSKAALLSLLE